MDQLTLFTRRRQHDVYSSHIQVIIQILMYIFPFKIVGVRGREGLTHLGMNIGT